MKLFAPFAFALIVFGAGPARAAQNADTSGSPASLEDESKPSTAARPEKTDKKGKGEGKSPFEFKGRVFALGEYRSDVIDAGAGEVDGTTYSLSIPSARAGVKVRILDEVSLVLEADFAGSRASIRDGYLQAKGKRWLVRAGRFKMPISAFTLESPWTLPRARRGLLDDLLSEHMLLSGRREGLMVRWEGGGFWDPAISAGAFQSIGWGIAEGDPIRMQSPKDVTAVGRISIEPSATEIALVAERRVTVVGTTRSFQAAGVDVTSDVVFGSWGLRSWGEAMLGESWYRQGAQSLDAAAAAAAPAVTFFEARVMGALRRGGMERGEVYGEVFFSAGLLDPDADVTQDHFLELSGGVNVGHWQRTRLTLEIEHGQSARNFPDSMFRDFLLPTVVRYTAALLQVGAAF